MPGISAARRSSSRRERPSRLAWRTSSRKSSISSSPSPSWKRSKKSAMGSGLQAQGPPPMMRGQSSPRPAARTGIPASSSIFRTVV